MRACVSRPHIVKPPRWAELALERIVQWDDRWDPHLRAIVMTVTMVSMVVVAWPSQKTQDLLAHAVFVVVD